MWFVKRIHPLTVLALVIALTSARMYGSESMVQALGGALVAAIFLSIFELYKWPGS